ncbi:MAG TPA: ATP-binding protein [Verrucomicrobiales bacterium]|nr:ATP-binding protein [Verrucomicrobiales bacterium]
MTISQRILLHVAAGAGLVIAVATAVTYGIVYSDAKDRELKHLETYVRERSKREENTFRQVESNLALVRGQFLKRMEGPVPADYQTKWNERFELFPDGSWRSRKQFADGRKWSTLWAHKNAVLSPEWQTQILRAQDICNELLPGWVDSFPSVYFVLPGWANIGFDPRIPAWVWDTVADYLPLDLEWFQIALPKNEADARDFGWTGVLEEPTTKLPLVSVYAPLRKDGRFLGSVGHDIDVTRLIQETARSGIDGAMHAIFRQDGRLVAYASKRDEIIKSKGQYRMQDSGDSSLVSLYRTVSRGEGRQFSGFDEGSDSYYSVARLAGPEWFFLTTMPRHLLQQQAFRSTQWVLWSGLASIALVAAFLATVLRRQIAQPLQELTRATRQMSGGDHSARAEVKTDDELGTLAGSFNEMAGRVAAREADLRHLNLDLEQRVEQRTAELTEANRQLDEGREEALRLLARERELSELKSDFVTLVSHEFRTPLEIIISSADNLQRYHDRLPPEKRDHLLRTINKAVRRMSGMMEEVLVLGRLESDRMTFHPAPMEFHSFCQRVCDEIESATGKRCPIQLHMDGAPDEANGDESLLRHIFTNLLSNAVKYSPAGEQVRFSVERDEESAVCRIADKGCGIPEADRKRLFQAFHRGSNVRQIPGTGLGLLIVQRCVDLHGGEISYESVEGQGTAFTVRLPLFSAESI